MNIVERLKATHQVEADFNIGGVPIFLTKWVNPDGPEAADEIERLREAIKVQANAVRSLQESETTEINRLRKTEREAHIAIETLDSERKANAILTDEIDRLREELRKAGAAVERLAFKMPPPNVWTPQFVQLGQQIASSALPQKESE